MQNNLFILFSIVLIISILVIFFIRKKKTNKPDGSQSTALVPVKIRVEGLTRFRGNMTEDEVYAEDIGKIISGDNSVDHTPQIAKNKNDEGVAAFAKGEIEKAISLYSDAIRIDPSYHLAIYNLGNSYFEIADYKNAIKNFEKVVMLDSKDEYAYYNLAMSYYKLGELNTATVYYQKAVDISPGDYTTHYNLGKVYEKLNQIDLAIEAYTKAINLKSDYANAHYNLAELLKYKGKNRQAIQEYECYLKYNPSAEDSGKVKKTIVNLMMK